MAAIIHPLLTLLASLSRQELARQFTERNPLRNNTLLQMLSERESRQALSSIR